MKIHLTLFEVKDSCSCSCNCSTCMECTVEDLQSAFSGSQEKTGKNNLSRGLKYLFIIKKYKNHKVIVPFLQLIPVSTGLN